MKNNKPWLWALALGAAIPLLIAANIKISELPSLTDPVADGDTIILNDVSNTNNEPTGETSTATFTQLTTYFQSALSFFTELVDDLTPQLGGDLDVNGHEIQSTGNVVVQLGDFIGANFFEVQDSTGATAFKTTTDGVTEIINHFTINKDNAAEPARFYINTDDGQYAGFLMQSNSLTRWAIGKSVDAETGTPVNTGSNFSISRYNDAGSYMDTPTFIDRSTGALRHIYDFVFTQQTDHKFTPAATLGGLWVKNTNPTSLIFTDSIGNDIDISTPQGSGDFNGTYLDFLEQVSRPFVYASGHGYIWVSNTVPTTPIFTDDTGIDRPIMTALSNDDDPAAGGNIDMGPYRMESSSGNFDIKLPDAAGNYMLRILDSNNVPVWCVDSNGNLGC